MRRGLCRCGCKPVLRLSEKQLRPCQQHTRMLYTHAGRPSQEDLDAIQSPFAGTMMESCSVTQVRVLCQSCSRHGRQRHQ